MSGAAGVHRAAQPADPASPADQPAPAGAVPRSIALVGAECTGKTSLAIALARELPALWLPEVLRGFCERHGRTPRADEQAALVREQLDAEARLLQRAGREGLGWVVLDSTPLVTALYSLMLFDDDSLLAQAVEHQRRQTLTLLADVDLPWVADVLVHVEPHES